MYTQFFKLREMPFSITPDPAYLYMSPRHQEALGHLLYGTGQYGGFVQLTGEVGTGKTTVVRTLLEQKLEGVEVAMIHNPRQSEREFVQSLCDELRASYPGKGRGDGAASLKTLVDALNQHLLRNHAEGKRTVLIIDEAQNLAPGVLEQVRLLTNLETHKEKLLRIMLVGQPELSELLSRQDLRQLASRITARYHLTPLDEGETAEYVRHRLGVAGTQETLFPPEAIAEIQRYTRGVPRLINALCDRALLGAYSTHQHQVSAEIVRSAASEVLGPDHGQGNRRGGGFFGVLDRRRSGGLPRLTLSWFESVLMALALMIGGALIYQTVLGLIRPEPVIASRPAATTQPGSSATAPVTTQPPAPSAVVQRPATVTLNPPAPPVSLPDRKAMDRALASTPALAALTNRLIRLWDSGLSVSGNVCAGLKKQGLECYRTEGDVGDLRSMDRPAILTVRDRNKLERHLLISQMTEDRARVELASGSVDVALNDLSEVWTGDMLLLWRRETKPVQIAPGQRGPHILWLRDRLGEMMGKPAGARRSDRYDEALKEEVRLFQKARGMEADGVVGIRTRIALSDPAPGTPTLTFKP